MSKAPNNISCDFSSLIMPDFLRVVDSVLLFLVVAVRPSIHCRVVNQVVHYVLFTWNWELRFSIRRLYCNGTFVLTSTKASVQPDGSPCTSSPPSLFSTMLTLFLRSMSAMFCPINDIVAAATLNRVRSSAAGQFMNRVTTWPLLNCRQLEK